MLAPLLALLLMVLSVQVPLVALAGVATQASLTLSDQTISTAANHTLTFVTPTGVESSTDTIVVDYEAGFSLASIGIGDIDLAYDDDDACDGSYTDVFLDGVPGAGFWGVSFSGQTITFTAPTDAGAGEIPAGRCVQIQIGTNAAGGSSQIVNPGSSGSYEVNVYGTFGDRTLFSVGIAGNSGVAVSATVSGGGGGIGSGGGGPSPGDTTAPVISNIVVQDITASSARITWTTNEPATTSFVYGTDTSYTDGSLSDSSYRTSHERIISGLLEGTEYHFLIDAEDSSGNNGTSGDQTFSTLDLTPPVISGLGVSFITETSAIVTWETDEPATSQVTGAFSTVSSASLTNKHEVTLTGLDPETIYNIVVTSEDASGNSADSSTNFKTLADLPPTAPLNFTATPGNTLVNLSWTNPAEADFAEVQIYASTTGYPATPADGVLVYSGAGTSTTHTGLTNGVRYYYTIFAYDLGKNVSAGANATAVPTSSDDPVDPEDETDEEDGEEEGGEDDEDEEVTEGETATGTGGLVLTGLLVSNVTETSATVSWNTNAPTDARVTIDGAPTVYDPSLQTVHAINVSGLSAGQTYTVVVESIDASGNRVVASTTFSTPAEEALVLRDVRVITDSPTGATVIWETDVPTRGDVTIVEVGTFSGPGLVTGHEIELTELKPDTLYVARVRARDASGEEVVVLVTFRTPAESQPVARVLRTQFQVARDMITLTPVGSVLRVLPGRDLTVQLEVVGDTLPTAARLLIGESAYTMTPVSSVEVDGDDQQAALSQYLYSARIMTPGQSLPMVIEVLGSDGETSRLAFDLRIVGAGLVTSEEGPLPNVLVTAMRGVNRFDAVTYAQQNPLQTSESGGYAWYVPNGTYRIQAAADGYVAYTSANIQVANNILGVPVTLIKELPPLSETDEPLIAAVVERVGQAINVVRQNPTVQTTATVATPVVAVAAVSTAGILAASFNAIGFFQYLLSAPFLFFWRRKRKQWGVVYDSLKKTPLDLAIVRLEDAATGRTIKSTVTDKQGRYVFIATPGAYHIDVRKPGYTYPSKLLKGQRRDGDYLDLYHGESIDVTQDGAAITANIPLDIADAPEKSVRQLSWDTWKRRIMYGITILGLLFALGAAVINPNAWTISVVVGQVLVLLLFLRLARPKKPTNWGIVYDKTTRRPLAKAIVRIFDPKYNKLLETRITDGQGRYAFLVGPSAFYATYDKNGYQTTRVDPIDRTDAHGSSYVSVDVGLNKHN